VVFDAENAKEIVLLTNHLDFEKNQNN
jgi:hypothetical protein